MNRLTFDGNVRDLANALIVPLFYLTYKIAFNRSKLKVENNRYLIYFTLLAVTLLLTVSKGVILSYFIAVLILFVGQKGNLRNKILLLTISALGIVFISFTNLVDLSRFFERNYDLNGRTRIWEFYFDKISNLGNIHIIFGAGPGQVNRIGFNEYLSKYYSHSVFLDFYFTLGLVGAIAFVSIFIYLGIIAFKRKNIFALSFLALIFLTYFTHGAATNVDVFIYLATSHLLIYKNQYKNINSVVNFKKIIEDSRYIEGTKI